MFNCNKEKKRNETILWNEQYSPDIDIANTGLEYPTRGCLYCPTKTFYVSPENRTIFNLSILCKKCIEAESKLRAIMQYLTDKQLQDINEIYSIANEMKEDKLIQKAAKKYVIIGKKNKNNRQVKILISLNKKR